MPLGTEVDLGPDHCVRWGPSSPLKRAQQPPHFLAHVYCGQTAGWIKMPLGTDYRGRSRPRPHCWDQALPKGAQQPSPVEVESCASSLKKLRCVDVKMAAMSWKQEGQHPLTGQRTAKSFLIIYTSSDSQPFRFRANSLPGANRPIKPWPIRSLANSLPGTFAP